MSASSRAFSGPHSARVRFCQNARTEVRQRVPAAVVAWARAAPAVTRTLMPYPEAAQHRLVRYGIALGYGISRIGRDFLSVFSTLTAPPFATGLFRAPQKRSALEGAVS